LPEGLLADNAARMRATTGCEVYRVRQSEFKAVVSSTTEWLGTFQRLEKEAFSSCRARLKSARAVCQFSRTRGKAAGSQALIAWDQPPTPTSSGVRQQASLDIPRVRSAPSLTIQADSLSPVAQHQLTVDDYFRPCTPQPIPSRLLAMTLPALGMNKKDRKKPLANFNQPSAIGRCSSSPGKPVSRRSQASRKQRQGS